MVVGGGVVAGWEFWGVVVGSVRTETDPKLSNIEGCNMGAGVKTLILAVGSGHYKFI